MDRDSRPHFTVKCRPGGKPGNDNITKHFGLLIGPDMVTRPNTVLLLLLLLPIIIVIVLHNGNEYLHTFEFPACDAWAIFLFEFRILAMYIFQYLLLDTVRIKWCDLLQNK